ncbi:hypothetical protein AGDE_15035 [Angomonas deanei]|uniref:Histone RNA hairpin-binding protein RNA-binding domain containing protein, putative n=1 Tax=Angomonas deanei TaxID=59799 RepID=A0A7G2CEW3_9TRYP|nr:hypothetical protein AGDE_15035 [Angomonas deanei]CAD2217233.1 Histone RNA hairpin-binding protein RNA-binding domain containing protein, putative [Angomonas deanei]|eukprot:EPY19793.1 hypothetical protein AGDE_15035 [Angomonas deanei]
MVLLIESDPLLQEGKLLPIAPPSLTLHSKRQWDIELRKWRRALHMFDYVYLDDDEEQQANKKPVYKRTEYKKSGRGATPAVGE